MQEHNFQIEITPNTKLITLFIPLEKLHKLFTTEDLPILSSDHIQQKIYQDKPMHQSILLTLLPLYKIQINKTIEHTYYYGKFLEVVSLYFSDKGDKVVVYRGTAYNFIQGKPIEFATISLIFDFLLDVRDFFAAMYLSERMQREPHIADNIL